MPYGLWAETRTAAIGRTDIERNAGNANCRHAIVAFDPEES